jgi:predicted ABC-type ATPase
VPLLTIIAGPNGSGKSTLTKSVDFDGLERLLDPDAVARALNPMNPAAAAIAAGREVLKTIDSYLGSGVSFAVETTLSGKGNLDLIDTAKARGYDIHLVFVGVDTPERSISRVRSRAARGGHFIPDADVRRRYERAMANSPRAFRSAGIATFYDNSEDQARLILIAKDGYGSVANRSPAGLGQTLSPRKACPTSTTIEVQCLGKPSTSKPSAAR